MKNAASLARPGMWQRMRTGSATKGAKDYHWAMIEITPDDTPEGHDSGHAFLLLRRHRYTGEKEQSENQHVFRPELRRLKLLHMLCEPGRSQVIEDVAMELPAVRIEERCEGGECRQEAVTSDCRAIPPTGANRYQQSQDSQPSYEAAVQSVLAAVLVRAAHL